MNVDGAVQVQAWATVALFVAAVAAGAVAYRLLKIEQDRDNDRVSERHAEQASHVAAWIEMRGSGAPAPFCVIANRSNLPIYDVEAGYVLVHGFETSGWETQSVTQEPLKLHVLAPDMDAPWSTGIERGVANEWSEIGRDEWSLRVEVDFRDAAGLRWHRAFDGSLIQEFDWSAPGQ